MKQLDGETTLHVYQRMAWAMFNVFEMEYACGTLPLWRRNTANAALVQFINALERHLNETGQLSSFDASKIANTLIEESKYNGADTTPRKAKEYKRLVLARIGNA